MGSGVSCGSRGQRAGRRRVSTDNWSIVPDRAACSEIARPAGGAQRCPTGLGSLLRAGVGQPRPFPAHSAYWRIRMRRRPSRLVAVTAAVFVLAACEARSYGTPPSASPDPAPLIVVAPQGPLAPLPEAAPDEPASSFDGLDGRTQQATAEAAAKGADITTVVHGQVDRSAGHQRQRQRHRHRIGGQAVHRRRHAAARPSRCRPPTEDVPVDAAILG